MRKHITEETMCFQLISIEVKNQSHDQLLLRFPDARNFAVVVKKGHVEENLLRLTRRSYAKMRRSDRNLSTIETNTADAS